MTKKELFLKLSNPDKTGRTRWVFKTEFTGEYVDLYFNNGCPWLRSFNCEYETSIEGGVWKCRLIKTKKTDTRPISKKVKEYINSLPSAHSGLKSINNDKIVPDHKNGRYNDSSALSTKTQLIQDFQPLTNRENLFKRQICKVCTETNKRFDAKQLGFSTSFIEGDENYNDDIKCNGCYWFDCIKFKNSLIWK